MGGGGIRVIRVKAVEQNYTLSAFDVYKMNVFILSIAIIIKNKCVNTNISTQSNALMRNRNATQKIFNQKAIYGKQKTQIFTRTDTQKLRFLHPKITRFAENVDIHQRMSQGSSQV